MDGLTQVYESVVFLSPGIKWASRKVWEILNLTLSSSQKFASQREKIILLLFKMSSFNLCLDKRIEVLQCWPIALHCNQSPKLGFDFVKVKNICNKSTSSISVNLKIY